MNAIENNRFRQEWEKLGKELVQPQAILSISAHWLTHGTKVTIKEWPQTIHDFGGFPQELYLQQYPAPGNPNLASEIIHLSHKEKIEEDHEWGLDHGTWSVLKPMFPLANIPVVQLSIDYNKPMEYHYQLAQQLQSLREKGVLIVGSGNLVHNLYKMRMDEKTYDWAEEFDQQIAQWIEANDDQHLIKFQDSGAIATMAHPTYDHYLPLLYTLGIKNEKDQISFFNTGFQLGSVSMRSVIWK